jgi:hypothetical protein
VAPVPGRLALSDCSGWSAGEAVPAAATPGSRPAGWAASQAPIPGLRLEAFRCARVSVGPFERGPVHLLLDTHGNAEPPQACAQGATRAAVLALLWLDDAPIAAYLNATFGVPAQAGPTTSVEETTAGATLHDWSWGPPGAAPSRLQVPDAGEPSPLPTTRERYFWPRGAGVAALELDVGGAASAATLPATGQLRPPMLMAQVAGGTYAGVSDTLAEGHADGRFLRYADAACEVPA